MAIGVNSGIGYDALTKKVMKKPAFTTSQGTTPSSGLMNILNTRASQAGMGASAIGRAIQATQPRVSNPADAVRAQMQPAAPSQFSYDPSTDPVYQKALAQARSNAQSASGDAMAALNKRGILDSTITSDRVAGIQQDAVSNVDANLLPQLSAQAFQRYQDAENQKNQADQLAIQQGQLTGYYQTPEMKQQYAIVDQAKQDYANAKTPEERIAAHQRAVAARSALDQMNANSDLVGSDVTLDQARGNTSKFGVQTQAAKEYDTNLTYQKGRDATADKRYDSETSYNHSRDQQSDLVENRNFNYQAGRDKVGDAQWQKEFNNRVQQQGVENAISWANQSLAQDDNDRQWASLDYQQSETGQQKSVSGAAAGDILSQSLQKVVGTDPSTGKPVYGTVNNPKAREQAFVEAWNSSGVAPGADTVTMLSKAGYTATEIADLKKNYPAAFQ